VHVVGWCDQAHVFTLQLGPLQFNETSDLNVTSGSVGGDGIDRKYLFVTVKTVYKVLGAS